VNVSPGSLIGRHWLLLTNLLVAMFLAAPFAAPLLMQLGRADLANLIYSAYQLTCHEWPFRAYFMFGLQATYSASELQAHGVVGIYDFKGSPELGYKVAFCARNVAIYAAVLAAGLVYARRRYRAAPLSIGAYSLAMLPMALDGLTQLTGWRESTWELRSVTGAVFGAASVWLLYPRFDRMIASLRRREPTTNVRVAL
jgi:uncharacterized membrane protein